MDVSSIALLCGGFTLGLAVGASAAIRWASWNREDDAETAYINEVLAKRQRAYFAAKDWLADQKPRDDMADALAMSFNPLPWQRDVLNELARKQAAKDGRPFGKRTEKPPQPDYGWPSKKVRDSGFLG